MKESWKSFIEKKGIKKWFQRDNLIIIVLSGILLLIISLPIDSVSGSNEGENAGSSQGGMLQSAGNRKTGNGQNGTGRTNTTQTNSGQTATQQSGSGMDWENADYEARLERRLQTVLEGMEGVGEVQVMITFQSSEEQVVEKNQPIARTNTTESDSQGGSRSVYQTDSGEETVFSTQDGSSQPFVIKTLTPRVEGVVVVAQGAGTGDISKDITEVVQALFGIEAHKIKVVKAE